MDDTLPREDISLENSKDAGSKDDSQRRQRGASDEVVNGARWDVWVPTCEGVRRIDDDREVTQCF